LNTKLPLRGEIWQVDLNPTRGSEIKKERPVIVVSSDAIGTLPIKLIAPITEWKNAFTNKIWLVPVEPTSSNGLIKKSAIDTLQLRGVDMMRFTRHLGVASHEVMEEITAAIALVIEFT
jgi:mRNA interferase MazF